MNIVKKLKLALLATSVMLFPKAGHTMLKLEDEKPSAGSSRQLPSGPEQESVSLTEASSSGSLQATSAASTLQQTTIYDRRSMFRMRQDFGRYFFSSKEIEEARSLLHAKFNGNNQELKGALASIRTRVIDQFDQPEPFNIDESRLGAALPALQNLLLTSLKIFLDQGTLEKGREALEKRTHRINEILVESSVVPLGQASKYDKKDRRYIGRNMKLVEDFSKSQKNSHYLSLISDLTRLQPEQLEFLANYLSLYSPENLFPPSLGSSAMKNFQIKSISKEELSVEEKISILGLLAKKSPIELNNIKKALKKLVPEKSRGTRMHINILEALAKLDFDKFKARAERFYAKITLPLKCLYGPLENDLLSLSLRLEDKDFTDFTTCINSATINMMAILMPKMATESGRHSRVLNPSLWELSFPEIKKRISAINAYSGLLYEAAQEGTVSNIEGIGRFMALTPVEIYETARSQHAKNYFFRTFLNNASARFVEITGQPASDVALQALFPSKTYPLTDFSPEVLQGELGNFRDLFQLPPFPEFQPSESSDPELEEAASSSSSAIHSAPITFRTTGVMENANVKHSAIALLLPYQYKPDAAYSLIINHRTKDKGSEVRVFNPNTNTYIDLGRLSSSTGFSDQVFNLSSLFASATSSSSGASTIQTELNFRDGISDIHSFTIKSGEERLKEVILGDKASENQTGVRVYAPERLSEKLQEWSPPCSEDVEE